MVVIAHGLWAVGSPTLGSVQSALCPRRQQFGTKLLFWPANLLSIEELKCVPFFCPLSW